MSDKKVALIDLDDTLAATSHHMLQYGKDKHNSPYHHEELTRKFREDEPDDYKVVVKDFLANIEQVEAITIYPFVPQALKTLKDLGYEIHLATARKSNLHPITPRWLEKHGLSSYIDAIHPRPDDIKSTKFKIDVAEKIGATVAFDDTYNIAEALAGIGLTVYLIEKPWNKDEPLQKNMILVRNFEDAVDQLIAIEKPASR